MSQRSLLPLPSPNRGDRCGREMRTKAKSRRFSRIARKRESAHRAAVTKGDQTRERFGRKRRETLPERNWP